MAVILASLFALGKVSLVMKLVGMGDRPRSWIRADHCDSLGFPLSSYREIVKEAVQVGV